MFFFFFTVHSVSEKAHRTCRQSTCSTANDISSIFLGDVNSAVIFTLDKLSDKLFISAGKEKKQENIDLKDLEQEKDFGQKLLMYKIRRDDYTSLHYCAQLKFTIWKGGVGNISKWFQKHLDYTVNI